MANDWDSLLAPAAQTGNDWDKLLGATDRQPVAVLPPTAPVAASPAAAEPPEPFQPGVSMSDIAAAPDRKFVEAKRENAAGEAADAAKRSQSTAEQWAVLGKEHYDNLSGLQKNWVFRTADRIADTIGGGVEDMALTAGSALGIPGAQGMLDEDRKFNEQKRAMNDYADAKGNPIAGLASKVAPTMAEIGLAAAVPGGPAASGRAFLGYATANSLQNHLNQQYEDGSTGWQHPYIATGHAAIDAASIYAGGKLLGAPLERLVGIGGTADDTITQKASQYVTDAFGLGKASEQLAKIPVDSVAQAALGAATTVAHNVAGRSLDEPGATKQDLLAQMKEQLPTDLATGGVAGVAKYLGEVAGTIAKRQQTMPTAMDAIDRAREYAPKMSPEQIDAAKAAATAKDFATATGIKGSSAAFRDAFNAHVDGFAQTPPAQPDTSAAAAQPPNVPPASQTSNAASPPPEPAPNILDKLGSQAMDTLDAVKSLPRTVADFMSVKPIPNLSRAGVENEAFAHASAQQAAPYVTNDMMAKVFPDTYHDPEAMAPTIQTLNGDNVLGIYDDFVDKHRNAERAGDQEAAEHFADKADAIGTPEEIDALQKQVASAPQDVRDNIARWNEHVTPELDRMFHEQLGLDPQTVPVQRGRNFGARINLLDVDREAQFKNLGDESATLPQMGGGGLRNPDVKRDPYARAASGTGEYSTDPEAVLNSVLYRRMNEVTKLRLYKALVDKGQASWGDAPVDEGNGNSPTFDQAPPEGYKKLPVISPSPTGEGTYTGRNLWFKDYQTYREARRVLDTDMRPQANPILKGVTGLQTGLSIADFAAHMKSIHADMIGKLNGTAAWDEVLRKTPILAQADVFHKLLSTGLEVNEDTPKIREELAFLAKNGMLRSHTESANPMSNIIGKTDTAARVIANRMFQANVDRGAAVDSLENRRQYVNRIGVYNRRLMGETESRLRDKGLSPFIVAGRSINASARRMVTADPGFETTSTGQAIRARGIQLAGLAAAGAVPAVVNAAINHGNPFGPTGTPLGAVGWLDDDGKLHQFDLFQLMNIRRGLKATGMNSVLQAVNEKKSLNEVLGDSIHDVMSTAIHPWQGPAVSLATGTLTGQQLDMRQGPQKIIARNVGGGAKQYVENFRAALKNVLPTAYAAVQPILERAVPPDEDRPGDNLVSGLFKSPLSAAGIKTVNTPAVQYLKDAADRQGVYAATPASGERRAIAQDLRSGNTSPLIESLQSGELSTAAAKRIAKGSTKNSLQTLAQTASVDDALVAFDKANASEKRQLRPIIQTKLNNALKPGASSLHDAALLIQKMRSVGLGG